MVSTCMYVLYVQGDSGGQLPGKEDVDLPMAIICMWRPFRSLLRGEALLTMPTSSSPLWWSWR